MKEDIFRILGNCASIIDINKRIDAVPSPCALLAYPHKPNLLDQDAAHSRSFS